VGPHAAQGAPPGAVTGPGAPYYCKP